MFFTLFVIGFDDLRWESSCKIIEEFSEKSYLPSADGDFKLHLRTAPFDYNEIAMINIHIGGSYIDLGSGLGFNANGGRNMPSMDWQSLQKYYVNTLLNGPW